MSTAQKRSVILVHGGFVDGVIPINEMLIVFKRRYLCAGVRLSLHSYATQLLEQMISLRRQCDLTH